MSHLRKSSDVEYENSFNFALQHLNHYREITRSVSTDYFKTVLFANAGGLIALATAMLTIKTLLSSAKPPKINIESINFYASFVLFIIAIGLISSFLGYVITYINALRVRDVLWQRLNEDIKSQSDIKIEDIKDEYHIRWILKVLGTASGLSFLLSVALEIKLVGLLW